MMVFTSSFNTCFLIIALHYNTLFFRGVTDETDRSISTWHSLRLVNFCRIFLWDTAEIIQLLYLNLKQLPGFHFQRNAPLKFNRIEPTGLLRLWKC